MKLSTGCRQFFILRNTSADGKSWMVVVDGDHGAYMHLILRMVAVDDDFGAFVHLILRMPIAPIPLGESQ